MFSRIYCTNAQKNLLVKLMQNESQLSSGQYSKTFTRKDGQMKWMAIAKKLNAIPGATKDWRRWRKAWQDLRCKTKWKQAALVKESKGAGGGQEEPVIGIMSPVVVSGHSETRESVLSTNFEDLSNDYSTNEGDIFAEPLTISLIKTETSINSTPGETIPQKTNKNSVHDDSVSLAQRKLEIKENYYKRKLEILERQTVALEKIANNLIK